ncbi:MAG: M48 family metallopeptidase [Clostridiales bacterium]|nr:M48 family metallopeptidase [Clostridiales bacterium]
MKHHSEIRKVQCEQRILEYKLTRKQVKNINLRIKPDGKILVSANNHVPTDYIDNFIREKQDFIIRALDDYKEKQKNSLGQPKKYVDGEIFKLLGKSLRLNVIEDKKESVTSDGAKIFLRIKKENKDNLKYKETLVDKWLVGIMVEIFKEACDRAHKVFKKYGIDYPNVKIRYMTTRWGSCRPTKGNITLNSKLIEAPRECIDYVVFHEFAHFIHPNHSKKFYDFMTMLMPDWKERRKELNKLL